MTLLSFSVQAQPALDLTGIQVNRSVATASSPALVVGPDGDFVVLWQGREPGGGRAVFARRFANDGVALGDEFLVNDTFHGFHHFPAAAGLADGGFVAVLVGRTHIEIDSLLVRRFDAAGTPLGGATELTQGFLLQNAVASLQGGGFVVVWNDDRTGVHSSIYLRRFDSLGAPVGDEVLVSPQSVGSGTAPKIAAGADGAVVVWSVEDTALVPGVFARRLDAAGEPLGDPITVDATAGCREPDVVLDAAGRFIVAWSCFRPGAAAVFARCYSAGGQALGDRVRVETPASGLSSGVAVAGDAHGRLLFVWTHRRDLVSRYRARFFTAGLAALEPAGRDFPVFAGTAVVQSRPAVASDALGRFIVTGARSNVQMGSDAVVVARRVTPDTPEAPADCPVDELTLCLGNQRFAVQAEWRDFQGNQGRGRVGFAAADAGAFWFFHGNNLEVMVKLLDGRAINGHFWVFYGSLSNVEFTLTVVDTVTGARKRYTNPAGRFASNGDVSAFPAND